MKENRKARDIEALRRKYRDDLMKDLFVIGWGCIGLLAGMATLWILFSARII